MQSFYKFFFLLLFSWAYGVLLWEIITVGGVPYGEIGRQELLEFLMSEKRLEIPTHCNPEL